MERWDLSTAVNAGHETVDRILEGILWWQSPRNSHHFIEMAYGILKIFTLAFSRVVTGKNTKILFKTKVIKRWCVGFFPFNLPGYAKKPKR